MAVALGVRVTDAAEGMKSRISSMEPLSLTTLHKLLHTSTFVKCHWMDADHRPCYKVSLLSLSCATRVRMCFSPRQTRRPVA